MTTNDSQTHRLSFLSQASQGELVRAARVARGLSRSQLARMASCSEKQVAAVETGTRSFRWSKLVCVVTALRYRLELVSQDPEERSLDVEEVRRVLETMLPGLLSLAHLTQRLPPTRKPRLDQPG